MHIFWLVTDGCALCNKLKAFFISDFPNNILFIFGVSLNRIKSTWGNLLYTCQKRNALHITAFAFIHCPLSLALYQTKAYFFLSMLLFFSAEMTEMVFILLKCFFKYFSTPLHCQLVSLRLVFIFWVAVTLQAVHVQLHFRCLALTGDRLFNHYTTVEAPNSHRFCLYSSLVAVRRNRLSLEHLFLSVCEYGEHLSSSFRKA